MVVDITIDENYRFLVLNFKDVILMSFFECYPEISNFNLNFTVYPEMLLVLMLISSDNPFILLSKY